MQHNFNNDNLRHKHKFSQKNPQQLFKSISNLHVAITLCKILETDHAFFLHKTLKTSFRANFGAFLPQNPPKREFC